MRRLVPVILWLVLAALCACGRSRRGEADAPAAQARGPVLRSDHYRIAVEITASAGEPMRSAHYRVTAAVPNLRVEVRP